MALTPPFPSDDLYAGQSYSSYPHGAGAYVQFNNNFNVYHGMPQQPIQTQLPIRLDVTVFASPERFGRRVHSVLGAGIRFLVAVEPDKTVSEACQIIENRASTTAKFSHGYCGSLRLGSRDGPKLDDFDFIGTWLRDSNQVYEVFLELSGFSPHEGAFVWVDHGCTSREGLTLSGWEGVIIEAGVDTGRASNVTTVGYENHYYVVEFQLFSRRMRQTYRHRELKIFFSAHENAELSWDPVEPRHLFVPPPGGDEVPQDDYQLLESYGVTTDWL